ncbi:tankyrase-2 [Phalaenopsis equestris]|uniref:tankyrase-2 n=1 Tax=Phalaenopsis equestris TaxID=78828 RepID=UPI0009E590F8|nr:tankyrase-2 [Phalaenopsis equestris]
MKLHGCQPAVNRVRGVSRRFSRALEMGNPRTGSKKKNDGAESELHAAARAGNLRAVESICSSDPIAVNFRDKHSRTPLHLAAWSGHAAVVSYLCKNKADVGASAMDDTAAIHFASQKGHIEVIRILLSSGSSVKSTNRKGMTPLHFAAQASHLELAKYLIRKGANLNSKNRTGETPLDLIKSDEIRSLVIEYEQSLKNRGESERSEAVDELPPKKPSDAEDGFNDHTDDSCDEVDAAAVDADGRREKRRGEENMSEDSLPEVKRLKVPLAHLLAEDDMAEEL